MPSGLASFVGQNRLVYGVVSSQELTTYILIGNAFMDMRTYKIVVAYDGTEYFGWQEQLEKPTIAKALQDSFKAVFGRAIKLIAVSRTDAGVHALGQVAVFKTSLDITPHTLRWAWSNKLPEDIVIRSLELVPNRFSPHADVKQKTYLYHFFMQCPMPFVARYGWHFRTPISLPKLEEVLQVFVGTHDFRSFSTGDDRGEDTIRTIESISIIPMQRYNAYAIVIKGPKFLRYMIRRIVGAALSCASREDVTIDHVKDILARKNPNHTLPNAPAKGLVLYKIRYNYTQNSDINAVADDEKIMFLAGDTHEYETELLA